MKGTLCVKAFWDSITPEQRSELLSLSLTILRGQANLQDRNTGELKADHSASHVLRHRLHDCCQAEFSCAAARHITQELTQICTPVSLLVDMAGGGAGFCDICCTQQYFQVV